MLPSGETVVFEVPCLPRRQPSLEHDRISGRGVAARDWWHAGQGNEQIALLGFTNFAWHYEGAGPTVYPEFILATPKTSVRPLTSPKTVECLRTMLENYGVCPLEY